MSWGLALHGGAEFVSPSEDRKEYVDALKSALDRGVGVLTGKHPPSFAPYDHLNLATQSVIETVMALEDCDLFNSGRGSVFNSAGEFEMDAQVMDNRGHSGACVGLTRIRNPVLAAERIMTKTKHALVTSPSAEQFAISEGVATAPFEHFHTERRMKAFEAAQQADSSQQGASEASAAGPGHGTVGAVAKDEHGNIACAVSTGGTPNKMVGRVGDSPIVGAGCYAGKRGGVCGTGRGEVFLYNNTCGRVCAAMDYGRLTLSEACEAEMGTLSTGDGGVIAVDQQGMAVLLFNTQAMPRAMQESSGRKAVGIWKEWEEANF